MTDPVAHTEQLVEELEAVFATVEREDGRIVCRAGSATLTIDGHQVTGGMPLHEARLSDVTSIQVDREAGEVAVENERTSYTFRVP